VLLAFAAGLGVSVSGCGEGAESGPPAILYGADLCDHCRMVISEERHAAGARLGLADYRFDDPGCLVEFLGSEESAGLSVAWVHDERAQWLRVEEAWFVEDPNRGTPMGSGLMAFRSEEAARVAGERFGGEPGKWAELRPAVSSPAD
jgi:copper chaperone NosL